MKFSGDDEMITVIFDQRGCKAFFKRYVHQQAIIERQISDAVNREIATGMTKVKLATRTKVSGASCYEFRTNLGKLGSARLAFIRQGHRATVVFISHDLQKSTFSHELIKILGVTK